MSAQELESFQIGNLDLGDMTENDLRGTNQSEFRGYITSPGLYDLTVSSFKMVNNPKMKDGAGKQWGSVYLQARDNVSGKVVSGLVSVPVETLIYTSKAGSTSKVKTKIFSDLVGSITGADLKPQEIGQAVKDLPLTLQGAQFKGRVGASGDRVTYAGENRFNITLVDGSLMAGSDGGTLEFADRDSASEYYRGIKGYSPARGLSITGFSRRK